MKDPCIKQGNKLGWMDDPDSTFDSQSKDFLASPATSAFTSSSLRSDNVSDANCTLTFYIHSAALSLNTSGHVQSVCFSQSQSLSQPLMFPHLTVHGCPASGCSIR